LKLKLSNNEKKYLQGALSFNEAEKYIKKFNNKIFVIKYGGSALDNRYLANNFAKDLVLIKKLGILPVIVHGGGVQISETLKKKNIESKFINGLRVTDKKTITIVKKVLVNRINKKIVDLINQAGGKAISLPGHKKKLIEVKVLNKKMGFVGQPQKIKIKIIKSLLKKNFIPIIASLGFKGNKIFNINADTVAGELAASLAATRFYFITNIKGVMDENNKLIKEITPKKANELIKKKIIKEGMIPKVKTCLNAVKKSAKAAVILDGRVPKLLLKEIFTTKGVGTLIGKK
tara:strand:- start:2753 stop:3619 length:867 start_codon:yes stop_codon:yes gene_type:complete